MQITKTKVFESLDVYSSYLPFTFSEFNNTSNYEIDLEIETQSSTGEGITASLVKDFNICYQPLALAFKPLVTEVKDKSGVKIDWSLLTQNPGIITGTSNYVDKYLFNNNAGLNLESGSSLAYSSYVLPVNFTLSFMYQIPVDFDGIIFETEDGKYILGYNNILGINDANLTYIGNWTTENNIGYHNGLAKYSSTLDNSISYSFIGTGISSHFIQSAHMGQAEIFIDGYSYGIIDLYKDALNNSYVTNQISNYVSTKEDYIYETWNEISSKTISELSTNKWNGLIHKRISYDINNLINGNHTVKINVLGTKNDLSDSTEVEFEYFQTLNTEADNKFYTIIQGITEYSEKINITTNPFAFILFPDHALIKQYNTFNLGIPSDGTTTDPSTGEIIINPTDPLNKVYNLWGNMISSTWNELADFTWEFLAQENN